MEKENNLFEKIQNLLANFNGNFNILEEEININTQLEYFESSKTVRKNFDKKHTLEIKENLFSNETPIDEKKSLLVKLASIDQVEAYRVLERYNQQPDPSLKDWSILAMKENKMLLESVFLDQNQIFISTGLGGKGKKLRYFVVFLSKFNLHFDNFQKKIVKSEVEYTIKESDGEIEKLYFSDTFCSVKVCLPIESNINEVFTKAIDACNQFGEMLEENYILTNTKEFSIDEIKDVLKSLKTNSSTNSGKMNIF